MESGRPIFIGRTDADIDRAERLLKESGIDYAIALDGLEQNAGAVCFLGIVIEVTAENAEASRRLLIANGLAAGIL